MSKSIYFVVCFAMTLMAQSLNAQKSNLALQWKGTVVKEGKNGMSIGYFNDLNIRAVRHVEKTYNPDREFWVITNAGYRVKFQKDSIVYRIDYLKNGRWRNTIKSYDVSHAPKKIIWAIRPFLDDYNVTLVTELKYGPTVSYFINLEGFKKFKRIRIMDGEMELLTEYKKIMSGTLQLAFDPNQLQNSPD